MNTQATISIHPERNGDARVYVTATTTGRGVNETVLIYGGLSIRPNLFKCKSISEQESMQRNAERLQHGYQQFLLDKSGTVKPGTALLVQVQNLALWFQQSGTKPPLELFGPATIDQAKATLMASKYFRRGKGGIAIPAFELPAYPVNSGIVW